MLQYARSTEPDANAMEAYANTTPNTDSIDEERRRTSALWHRSIKQFVGVDKISTILLGMADLDNCKGVVGLTWFVNG